MNNINLIKEYREKLKNRLEEWIPDNSNLVSKELTIFDHIVSRRDFLKTTSVAAALITLGGCGKNKSKGNFLPSDWDDTNNFGNGGTVLEEASVSRASKIVVDSDIMDGVQQYYALPSSGSEDAKEVIDDAILESFNPHIITTQSEETLSQSGLKPITRNYGIPEIVQLCKNDTSDYYFNIYEELRDGSQGLKGQKIILEETASLHFTQLVVANGNYHNRVNEQKAYSQKMILLANTTGIENQALRMYYQTASSPLLIPGVKIEESQDWEYLDVIELFKASENSLSFENYTVLDIGTYEDGNNHNVLYGTIRFDDFYSYGFVATFTGVTDEKPTVTFFAPHFLSHQGTTIQTLNNSFNQAFIDNDEIEHEESLKDFALFAYQRFIPFVHTVDNYGKTQPNILFSFIAFDTSTDGYYNGVVEVDDESVDLSHFCTIDSTIIKRYILSVNTQDGGVIYPMESYKPEPLVELDEDYFTLKFDTSTIPTIDIWQKIYDPEGKYHHQADLKLKNAYVRSVKRKESHFEIILANSYFDTYNLGITHHALTLGHTLEENFTLEESNIDSTVSKMDSVFNTKGEDYKSLWFNDMVGSQNSYTSLSECINNDNGYFDFYCTHNRQGLLRSYFVVNVNKNHSRDFSHSFLLNFNEQGNLENNQNYFSQNHETLFHQIVTDTIQKHPPLPITLNPKKLHRWRVVGQDEEVHYVARRAYETDEDSKELKPNSGERTLYSYHHASVDALEGSWVTQEYTRKIPKDTNPKDYTYKTTKHHVHLHTNNIYNYPVTLEENRYLEVHFSKAIQVTDMTDPTHPSTYSVSRFSSLFLKTDSQGKISLEINAGTNNNDMFKGVNMKYRFLEKSDLRVNQDNPVGITDGAGSQTSEFMQCNISFKQFSRLSTQNIDKVQLGASSDTPIMGEMLRDNIKEGNEELLPKVTDAYAKLYSAAKPDNDTAPLSAATSTQHKFIHEAILSSTSTTLNQWEDKAKDTISNVAKTAEGLAEDIVDGIKKAIDTLVEDIDNVMSQLDAPTLAIINKLMEIMTSIIKIQLIYNYLSWLILKAIIDVNGAWDIGHETKKLFDDQLQPGGATYSIIENETQNIKDTIEDKIEAIKETIDTNIDISMGIYKNDNLDKKQALAKKRQDNSTRSHYLQDQMKILIFLFGANSSDSTSSTSMECSNGDTVEELVSCIMSEEQQVASEGIQTVVNDHMNFLYDLMSGSSGEVLRNDMATMQKDSVNWILDQMSVTAKGVVQVPLSFLNGSTLLESAYKKVNDKMSDVFKAIGLLLFQDKNKFQSIDDFGYFYIGEMLNFTLVFTETIQKSIGLDMDVKAYVQNGDFRTDINALVPVNNQSMKTHEEHESLKKVLFVAEFLDVIIESIHFSMDFAKLVEGEEPFEIFGRFLILARVILRTPKIIAHHQSEETLIKVFGMINDFLFMATMIINFAKKGYSWANPLEKEARLAWGLAYSMVNMITRIIGLTVAVLDTEAEGEEKTLKVIASSISLIQSLIKFYIENTPEPDPRVVSVNLALSAFKIVDVGSQLYLELNKPQ